MKDLLEYIARNLVDDPEAVRVMETQGQSALYLAETTTGQLGVYTMGPGGSGVVIRRHDNTKFRQAAAAGAAAPAPPGGLP